MLADSGSGDGSWQVARLRREAELRDVRSQAELGNEGKEWAAAERDVELVKDGRDAVGLTVGIPKRQTDKPAGPKDDLDRLVDSLDGLEI